MDFTTATPVWFRRFASVMAAVSTLLCGGCLSGGRSGPSREERRAVAARAEAAREFKSALGAGGRRVSIQELDRLTYGYADRYFMVISSAVDAIKRGNMDPVQRRLAHQIKLNGVLAMNDIVSSGDPYSETLDLVVAVT